MMMKILAMRDIKTNEWLTPLFSSGIPAALRDITDMIREKQHFTWCKHPEDFELYDLGEYDTSSGELVQGEKRSRICLIAELAINN